MESKSSGGKEDGVMVSMKSLGEGADSGGDLYI